MHFTGTKSSPYILLLLKHKKMLGLHGGFLTIAMYHYGVIVKIVCKDCQQVGECPSSQNVLHYGTIFPEMSAK